VAESPALSSAIINYTTPRFSPSEKRPEHLQKVGYWKREDYITEKKSKKGITSIVKEIASKNKNTMTWYVQDVHGQPVDGERVEAIRARARSIWNQLLRMGVAPVKWSDVGLDALDLYEHHMVTRFPELSYCDDNWKVHMIATDNYPSWWAAHGNGSSSMPIKIEDSESPPPPSTNTKRKARSTATPDITKKARMMETMSSPLVVSPTLDDLDDLSFTDMNILAPQVLGNDQLNPPVALSPDVRILCKDENDMPSRLSTTSVVSSGLPLLTSNNILARPLYTRGPSPADSHHDHQQLTLSTVNMAPATPFLVSPSMSRICVDIY